MMASSSKQRCVAEPDKGPAEELEEILYSTGGVEFVVIKSEPLSSNEDYSEDAHSYDEADNSICSSLPVIKYEVPTIDLELDGLDSGNSFDARGGPLGSSRQSNRSESLMTVEEDRHVTVVIPKLNISEAPALLSHKHTELRAKTFQAKIKPYRRISDSHTKKLSCVLPTASISFLPSAVTQTPANVTTPAITSVRPYNRYVQVKGRPLVRKEKNTGPKGSLSSLHYCYHCDYSTENKTRLRSHVLGHLPREHSCTICSYQSKTKKYLEKHMETHTGERHLSCTLCQYKTRWKHNLVTHMRTHSQEKPYACHLCPYKAKTSSSLKGHLDIHNDVRKWRCPYCPYAAVQKTSLTEHITRHTGEKNNLCPHCDFRTNRKSSLRDHIRLIHVRIKNLQCPYCEYRSAHKGNMKGHIRTHTDERPYACDKCYYRAHTSDVLKKHAMTHTGERPFACDYCSYRAVQETTMISHVNSVHLKFAPYQCHYCGYRTGRFRVLRDHINAHLGIRDKKCGYPGCKYRSNSQSSVNVHRRIHTGEKPYICTQCPYRCATHSMMRGHLQTHMTVKPFSCGLCNYSTARKINLTNHLMVHTGEKPFSCQFCPYQSIRAREARHHVQKHHPKTLAAAKNQIKTSFDGTNISLK